MVDRFEKEMTCLYHAGILFFFIKAENVGEFWEGSKSASCLKAAFELSIFESTFVRNDLMRLEL